jgi:hypothetical protein
LCCRTVLVTELWQKVEVGRIREEDHLRKQTLALKLITVATDLLNDDTTDTPRSEAQKELVEQRFAAPLAPGHPTVPTAFYKSKQQQAQGFSGYGLSAMSKSAMSYPGEFIDLRRPNAAGQGWRGSDQSQLRSPALPSWQSLGPSPPCRASPKPVQIQWPQLHPRVLGPQVSGQTAASSNSLKRSRDKLDTPHDYQVWELQQSGHIAVHGDSSQRPRNEIGTHHDLNELNLPKFPREAPHLQSSATSHYGGNPCQFPLLPPPIHKNSRDMEHSQTRRSSSIARGKPSSDVKKNTHRHQVRNACGILVRSDGQLDKRSLNRSRQKAGDSGHAPFSGPSSALKSGFGETGEKTGGERRENLGKRDLIGESRENPEEIFDTTGTQDEDEEWLSRAKRCEDTFRSMGRNQEIHVSKPEVVREVSEQCSEQGPHERPPGKMDPFRVNTSEPVASKRSGNGEEVVDAKVPNLADGASMAGDTPLARLEKCGYL